MYVGVGIMANALMPYLAILAFGFFLLQYTLIVTKEEEYLHATFGDEYERYMQAVHRFMPRLTRYSGEHSFRRRAELSRGLESERRTLQAFTVITIAVIILYFVKQG